MGTIKPMTSCIEKEGQTVIRITGDERGMSPEAIKQAFIPFFSMKAVG